MSSRLLNVNNKIIGDNYPCFITFEAGPTHDGLSSALQLVKEASIAGADAIKFQIFDADKLVADKKQLFSYSILLDKQSNQTKEISEPLYDILSRRCLSSQEWMQVKSYADELDLLFFATIGFEEDLNLLIELGCHSVKIASADVNHFPLLRHAARSGLNIQLDTGNADLDEIKSAVSVIEEEGCNSIIIHQCPSGYPAHTPSICLNMIKTLRDTFPHYPIAYSDHTPDADMDIAAVSLGVNLVEKTISMDRTTPSVEHIFSLEPHDMKKFITRIREVEVALGQSIRNISLEQDKARKLIRRSPYILESVQAGSFLSDAKVEFCRPGLGLSPADWESYIQLNSRFKQDMSPGDLISLSTLEN
ncbi:N-acetylneuraminate synthase family protein [Synechococcus sp. AH-601-N10]|nr:N-acetylneuraminate synthase family protein [Synechococcus sp. AH-601-N10]